MNQRQFNTEQERKDDKNQEIETDIFAVTLSIFILICVILNTCNI